MFLKKEGEDYILNFYRHKLYDKKRTLYLLTVDDGNFIFLNKEGMINLKKGLVTNKEMYERLLERGIIINDSNFNDIVKKTRKRYAFLMNGTSLHIVIPTSRCNLGCTYCFASPDPITAPRDEKDLDEKTAIKIVDFIMNSPSNAITIEFQGGEATARFDLVKIMSKHAKKLNKKLKKDLVLTIVSNLTLMTDDMANWLIDNDVSICTSLDGPKYVHDENRFIHVKEGKEVGTYDRVIYWIKRINSFYKKKKINRQVFALMTITKHSLPYYKEIIDEYVSLGIYLLDIRHLTFVGKAAQSSLPIHYSENEFIDFYNKSLEYMKELEKKGIRTVERMKSMYDVKVLENRPTYHTDFESPCGAATGQIVYHSNGDVYTCHEALGRDEFRLGNVFSDSWQDIFTKEETSKAILNSMLESNVKCDRCVFKPYCGTCMVENFYHFGKFNFYPTKTAKHSETIMQCTKIFDEVLEKAMKVN